MTMTLSCPNCKEMYESDAVESSEPNACAACQEPLPVKTAKPQEAQGDKHKKQSERIGQLRMSLQHSAVQAAAQVQAGKAKRASAPQVPQSAKKTAIPTATVGAGRRGSGVVLPVIIGLLLLGLLAYNFYEPKSVPEQCLEAFGKHISQQSLVDGDRLQAHRQRMWVTNRDGFETAPIILNVDEARISSVQRVDWAELLALSENLIGNKMCNRTYAMWHRPEDQKRIDAIWEEYVPKSSVEGFYVQLQRRDILFVRFAELPIALAKAGYDSQVIYVLSLLLAGDSSHVAEHDLIFDALRMSDGSNPAELCIWTFHGKKGQNLVDAGGYYDVTVAQSFCGILLGFSDASQEVVQCRVLDLRLADQMHDFYNDTVNPLRMAAYEAARRLARQGVAPTNVYGPASESSNF